jgi:hypothetical protein
MITQIITPPTSITTILCLFYPRLILKMICHINVGYCKAVVATITAPTCNKYLLML